ncbi:hypothetical protein AYL99_07249 [Fonsecaea erecta]|uniref:AB hydrolase-1 domain-containing protein n=1 Tax=Fonsecaea erecta TaxID=1367422 RepID=A0A178ZEE7_9EURO|nr:hypothetical protein AYL99_07249 [Fonsecaea erecta]OAP58159.1 hypothetical protein AYL99_07249 [Fonsecaea erecta]
MASAVPFSWPTPTEGDFVIKDFQFNCGSTLHELRYHYRTLGKLRKDAKGHAENAVLIMHGTTRSGQQFLTDTFAGELFGPGQLLDIEKYYIVLRDAIGHGQSSKPSDGLHARFPKYGYNDVVRADHLLLTEHLGVDHLRLVMGTSMGGMHTWLWSGTFPDFMDASMALACLPHQISGRNRVLRKILIDSIRTDPEFQNGDYTKQPHGLKAAIGVFLLGVSAPLYWQSEAPTLQSADAYLEMRLARELEIADANNMVFAFEASWDYDPRPLLKNIKAPFMAWNTADDQLCPPELQILEREIQNVSQGKAVTLPITEATRGHSSYNFASLFKDYLQEILHTSA